MSRTAPKIHMLKIGTALAALTAATPLYAQDQPVAPAEVEAAAVNDEEVILVTVRAVEDRAFDAFRPQHLLKDLDVEKVLLQGLTLFAL